MVHVVVPVLAVPAHAVEIGDGVQFLPEPGKIPVAAIIGRVGFFHPHHMAFLHGTGPDHLDGFQFLGRKSQKILILAGKQGIWKPRTLVGIWFVSMIFWGFQGFRYTTGHPMSTFGGLVLIWGCLLFGAMLPFGVLNHIIRNRQTKIIRQLPDVLDLLSISVQAGLSLDGAMRKVVERMEGPLIDEFRRMLRDVRMGMTRRRSMQLMARRCDVQDVYLFVMSVVQSERLGASMSDTLVIQADNMRDLRRQRARTQAMKAPVKMIFPLVFCIFPAIFVVVLLPSLISLMQGMK